MARIAFILLCHKDPDAIVAQAERLTAAGDCIAIHFDAGASKADYARIRAALDGNSHVTFPKRRLRCGWGEWSLVQATLNALAAALEDFPRCTHFYMLSGDCMPIKPAEYAHAFLDAEDVDYVESVDYFESDWIKTGLKEERLIYRHWFNEREHKRLFYASMEVQKRFGLTRRIPADLQLMIGSQWWCLRRHTAESVLDFCRERPDVMRFFRTTWIPDETFFQTLVRHLVPQREIRSRTLTFLLFSDYGMPVRFHDDHYDMLLGQDYLFARKISPEATYLKRRLGALYAASGVDLRISDEGRSLFHFLVSRGREGRRFAPRFWETESTLGRERELMIVICKKWHVGKRLLDRVRRLTDLPGVAYLFDEEATPLPDLGGIQGSMEKRTRHRRALMRLLFEQLETDRLLICLDPANIELLRDFQTDRSVTKLLEVECSFPEAFLLGHARRTGLLADRTPPDVVARLLPTVRADLNHESDRLRDAGFDEYHLIRETAAPERNAAELARFLSVPERLAREIAGSGSLFTD